MQSGGFLCEEMTKEIPLTQGMVAIVDDEDFERVSQYKWRALKSRNTFYARRSTHRPDRKTVLLHRFIIDAPEEYEVDHKDHNGLNCTRNNIRLATHSQNQGNRIMDFDNRNGYKGVTCSNGKWKSQIQVGNGKHKHLGRFDDILEAARAYDKAARELFGEFAKTNFD